MSDSARSLAGRIGAYAMHAKYDARDTTRNARQAFNLKFEREVDPKGELPLEERKQRAEAARRAYFLRLAAKSAKARRGRG